ncbi:hypothetical protein TREES_T100003421 [Tupaia chinensis]|uniref:Uncharacterized protein n=1 Tax=Tupaia chinensis TaxID=246437 RepID=L9JAY6_TUPCH|nr:hypothetical protein TREES_T100003421 [Tupaia chinensis]
MVEEQQELLGAAEASGKEIRQSAQLCVQRAQEARGQNPGEQLTCNGTLATTWGGLTAGCVDRDVEGLSQP